MPPGSVGGGYGFIPEYPPANGYTMRRAFKRPVAQGPNPARPTTGPEGTGAVRWLIQSERDKLGRLGLNPRTAPSKPGQGSPTTAPPPFGKPGSLSPGSIIGFGGLPGARSFPPNGPGGGVAPGGGPTPGGGVLPSITPRIIVSPSPASPAGGGGGGGGLDSTAPLFAESESPMLASGIDPTTGEPIAGGGPNWLLIAGAALALWFLLKR